MKKKMLSLSMVCLFLSGIISTSAAANTFMQQAPRTSYGTYNGQFEVTVTMPEYDIHGIIVEEWDLDVCLYYTASYNLNTGKIGTVTYDTYSFYPGHTTSQGGYARVTSINNEVLNPKVSADGYSITFRPSFNAQVNYYWLPSTGAGFESATHFVSGGPVTVTPETV